jgi:hypothetical protein
MPKTDNSITIAAWAGAFRNRDGAVRDTAVYAPGGYFASTGLATMSILAGSGFSTSLMAPFTTMGVPDNFISLGSGGMTAMGALLTTRIGRSLNPRRSQSRRHRHPYHRRSGRHSAASGIGVGADRRLVSRSPSRSLERLKTAAVRARRARWLSGRSAFRCARAWRHTPQGTAQCGLIPDQQGVTLGEAPSRRKVTAYSDTNFGEQGLVYKAIGFLPRASSPGAIRYGVRVRGRLLSDRSLRRLYGTRARAREAGVEVVRLPARMAWEMSL